MGLALLSCGEPEEIPRESTNFSFDSIEYLNSYGDHEVRESYNTNYPMTIYSMTSVEQSYIFRPQNNSYDRMTFNVDEWVRKQIGNEHKVKVPIALSEGDRTLVYDDGTRWNLVHGDQRLRANFEDETTLTIQPNHALQIISTFKYVTMSGRCRLHLKGDEFGEPRVTEPKMWVHRFVVGYDLDTIMIPFE